MRRITYGVFGSHGSSVAQIALSYRIVPNRMGGQVRNTSGRSKGGVERERWEYEGGDDSKRVGCPREFKSSQSSSSDSCLHNITSHDLTSHPIPSYPIPFHPITRHHTPSHPIPWHVTLLPTSMMTMLASAWSLNSFNQRWTFSNVTCFDMSYTSNAPTAPLHAEREGGRERERGRESVREGERVCVLTDWEWEWEERWKVEEGSVKGGDLPIVGASDSAVPLLSCCIPYLSYT